MAYITLSGGIGGNPVRVVWKPSGEQPEQGDFALWQYVMVANIWSTKRPRD